MSPEATSTAGRGYFDVPFYVNQGTWTMPATQQAALRGRLHAVPLPADLRPSGAGRHHQPDPGHRAVERDQPGRPACGTRRWPNYRYRGVESWGPATGKTDDVLASASYVTGAHSMKVGYQCRQLDLLDKDVANDTQLGYRFNQGVPNAVSYYLPDFGRRTITKHAQHLRPGQLDARPPDAAGRAALRPRVELRAGRTERHDQHVVPQSAADHHRSARRAWMRTTTSRRASASPTTCSAPARRR